MQSSLNRYLKREAWQEVHFILDVLQSSHLSEQTENRECIKSTLPPQSKVPIYSK